MLSMATAERQILTLMRKDGCQFPLMDATCRQNILSLLCVQFRPKVIEWLSVLQINFKLADATVLKALKMYDAMVVLQAIEPSVHRHRLIAASCLCIQVKMLEDGSINFDFVAEAYDNLFDVMLTT